MGLSVRHLQSVRIMHPSNGWPWPAIFSNEVNRVYRTMLQEHVRYGQLAHVLPNLAIELLPPRAWHVSSPVQILRMLD